MNYPKTVAAMAAAEVGLWPVVDALVDELGIEPATTKDFERVVAALEEAGLRPWSVSRLSQFHRLGIWTRETGHGSTLRGYPIEWVLEAKRVSGGEILQAIGILSKAKVKRDIRPDKIRAEQALAALATTSVQAEIVGNAQLAGQLIEAGANVLKSRHLKGRKAESEHNTNRLDGPLAQIEISLRLDEALKIARDYGHERFLLEQLQDLTEKLEREITEGTPAEAVADLEEWLASQ